ncbi:hypothetical protein F8388_014471 [Cannabis sativa]|uniref:Ankyrin repeat-containing protein n=1 Tax=Cannabis sativa TaxID=3483 RepID=A0A7J6G158_CANSA|nr:hypothetical protein F8388_014471 [Cannabis sativa]
MLGHVDFVKELLNHKPELAKELDMWRCMPLHLAVANDHLETVKLLLSVVDCEFLCTTWDEEGRNPLHLAAMRGVAPEAGHVGLKGQSGTLLHVCVRNNQLEAIKLLVDVIDDFQFVNVKNDYVNAVNANMFIAMDILAQNPRSEKDFDIVEAL